MYGNPRCKTCEGVIDIPDSPYCSFCKPSQITSHIKKQPKKKVEKYVDNRQYITIKCTGACGRNVKLRTNDPSMYTEEVRKTWQCLLCESKTSKSNSKPGWNTGL